MASIRVVIADDEPLARENVEALLEEEPDVEVVARCASGVETLRALREVQPDVVFLDLKMPDGGGLEVVAHLEPEAMPLVVFVTAFDEFAVAAFEARALDYILKPVDEARFREAMDRVRRRLGEEEDVELARRVRGFLESAAPLLGPKAGEAREGPGLPDRLRIQSRDRTYFVPIRDIAWIEAADAGVRLHTPGGDHIHRATLSDMQEVLDPARWVRIHRSHMVNVEFIREIQPYFHGDYVVILRDGTRLRMSRRRRRAIRRLIGH